MPIFKQHSCLKTVLAHARTPCGLRCAGAPHQRRRPVGLAKPMASNSCPMQTLQGKRKRCKAPQARPRVGPSGPPRPEVSGKAALNRERKQIKPDRLPKKSNNFLGSRQNPASQFCSLSTWWSWRGDHTRSHPEHGRETPLRQWYFVSRRGRVGHRQVRKTQNLLTMDDPNPTNISTALR